MKSDGTYSLELNNCDGTQSTILAAAACTVQVSTLITSPFSLSWGSSIFAKVMAINVYGNSATSQSGNGAVIITYADAPLSLTETVAARQATKITFTWTAGLLSGGSSVIDYQVFQAITSVGTYTSIATGVTPLSYTAVGLTPG